MYANQPEFDRLLVVVNPESTQFANVKQNVLARLDDSEWASRYTTVETKGLRIDANYGEHIGELILPNMAVIAAVGDGGLRETSSGLAQTEDVIRNSSYLVTQAGGSGNDGLRSIQGRVHDVDILDLLEFGNKLPLDLMSLKLDDVEEIALSYIGFGAMGDGAVEINLLKNREAKKTSNIDDRILDAITLVKLAATKGISTFKYSEGTEPNKLASEITFSNLKYMAGGFVKFEESRPGKVVCIEIGPDNFMIDIGKRFVTQRLFGGLRGLHLASREFTLESDVNANIDGDGRKIDAGTNVAVAVKASHINALALPKQYGLSLA